MSFVMIATGAASRARVRTLSALHLLACGAFASVVLLGAGGAAGYWLAGGPAAANAAPAASIAAAAAAATSAADGAAASSNAALPFALEHMGTLSGRLFRLESQAVQLGNRIGVLQKDEPAPRAGKAARGGPMLPARPITALEDLGSLDEQLGRIERQIALVTAATAKRQVETMRLPSRLPIAGAELVSPFGNRTDPFTSRHAFHAGLDFAAEHGTPIHSAAGGVVGYAGFRPDYGWVVEISHGNGLTTRYAHASKLLVTLGAVVTPGERIAMVGSTGRSTGAHLHFEVLRNGSPVDPRQYLARN